MSRLQPAEYEATLALFGAQPAPLPNGSRCGHYGLVNGERGVVAPFEQVPMARREAKETFTGAVAFAGEYQYDAAGRLRFSILTAAREKASCASVDL
jgi:hypothetical protein